MAKGIRPCNQVGEPEVPGPWLWTSIAVATAVTGGVNQHMDDFSLNSVTFCISNKMDPFLSPTPPKWYFAGLAMHD